MFCNEKIIGNMYIFTNISKNVKNKYSSIQRRNSLVGTRPGGEKMKCINHKTLNADGACIICGFAFCRECLVEYDNSYYCKKHMEEKVKQLRSASKNTPNEKSKLFALLLCMLFGFFGVHRFYLGKPITGIIWFFTFGFFMVGWFIDTILIAMDILK